MKKDKQACIANLNAIRVIIDADVMSQDIEEQKNKLIQLTQLCGLAAESMALAKKLLLMKELEVLKSLQDSKITPSILSKMVTAECYEEGALFVYADRINASISHSIDGLRSVLSLYKTELTNSLKE